MKYLTVVVLMLLFACSGKFTDDQLVGKWKAVEWKDITNNKTIDIAVDFTFEEDRYVAHYGESTEQGKYWITGEHLHTVEDGKAEKKVKIAKLQNDSLVFEMNRAGALEELVLVRER